MLNDGLQSDKAEKTDYYSDSFADHEGRAVKVHWTKDVWEYHLNKHPEIKSRENASKMIREALGKPSLVMEGRREGDGEEITRCYYKEHKRNETNVYFTKVVVGCNENPFYIKTVFAQWLFCDIVVQEKKYPNFKEIWREQKTYL